MANATDEQILEAITYYVKAPSYKGVLREARRYPDGEAVMMLVAKAFQAGVRWRETQVSAPSEEERAARP